MKTKSRRIFSTLLALALAFGLSAALPLTAHAEDDPFQVAENPVGAVYLLNEPAALLMTTFVYDAREDFGTIDHDTPIVVQWYWSNVNSNTDRSNPQGESTLPYDRIITCPTTLTPPTNTVGVRYYYAVIRYGKNVVNAQQQREVVLTETACEPARIEVRAPEPTEHGFRVKKTDEDGNPLAGAVIALVPDSGYQQGASVFTHEETTGADGFVSFSATDGYYILGEKQAPSGYNATDEKYYIHITANGVYIYDPITRTSKPYEMVTFVNKEIPQLNKEDHFAFMQGYPEGTFLPSRNMTRAEAVVMFSRLLVESMSLDADYRNDYYPDVRHGAWYAGQVGYMQTLGVLADYSRDGMFRPDEPVTRAEFATLAAHFDHLTPADTNSFSDVPGSHWAVKYINSAAAKGWITGYADGTFRPEANITRAEVVTLVGRMLERAADSAYLEANVSSLPRNYSDLTKDHWAYLAIMEASIGHDYVRDSAGEHWTAVY